MKKMFLILSVLFFSFNCAFAIEDFVSTYSEDGLFGLTSGVKKITEAKYKKLIRLKDSSWLFLQKNKYGIMNNEGQILVEPKFSQAYRYAGRFAKLGNRGLYTLYDENANIIIPLEYSSIDILYGKMFLVEKKYKYGLISYNGDIILAPVADDIYMPKPNILKIQYDGIWYEIEHKRKDTLELPADFTELASDDGVKITQIIQNPIASAGLGVVSAGDYFIKLFSSISPAYEQTIDELIFNKGADGASALIKCSWLLKFPFVYGKNYINNLAAPNNGPLSDVKANLKNKINN